MIAGNRILLGQYRPGTGFIYRLDPRTKILVIFAVMVVALLSQSPALYGFLIVVLLAVLAASRLGWGRIAGNLKPIFWFVVFTAGFHILFSGKDDPQKALEIGSFAVSETAVRLAYIYSARILIFVLSTFLLSLTTSPLAISEAIVALLKPLAKLRLPVYDLGMILFIALRFIPVMADEIDTIRKAQYIRGVEFSGNLLKRVKNSMALIMPVFFSALRRADDLSVAIETRGYRSGRPRSSLDPLKFRSADYGTICLSVATLTLCLIWSRI